MDFSTYQNLSRRTAVYPDLGANLAYPTLGLNGEAGEVAEIVKKLYRDRGGILDASTRKALAKELGDVLWYVAAICAEANLDMQSVAELNVEKLADRQSRDVLHGSGDNR
jgi:NTP pyrophosphatase (non-canonical NTP hydrolase)